MKAAEVTKLQVQPSHRCHSLAHREALASGQQTCCQNSVGQSPHHTGIPGLPLAASQCQARSAETPRCGVAQDRQKQRLRLQGQGTLAKSNIRSQFGLFQRSSGQLDRRHIQARLHRAHHPLGQPGSRPKRSRKTRNLTSPTLGTGSRLRRWSRSGHRG